MKGHDKPEIPHTCRKAQEALAQGSESPLTRAHLQECAACQAVATELARTHSLVLGVLAAQEPWPDLSHRVRASLVDSRARKAPVWRYALAAGLAGLAVLTAIALRANLTSAPVALGPQAQRTEPSTVPAGDPAITGSIEISVRKTASGVELEWQGRSDGSYTVKKCTSLASHLDCPIEQRVRGTRWLDNDVARPTVVFYRVEQDG